MNLSGMAKVIGVGLATFMSASGGPYVVLMMQGFVAAWERVLGKVQGRWAALFTLFGLTYVGIDLFSTKTPFHVFVNYFTFSKQSAYNRILIFEYGTAEVARHPVFGIGLGDWERPVWMSDSMDNFWLVTAVRYGVPAFLLLLGLLLGILWKAGQRKNLPPEWKPRAACLGLHAFRHHGRRRHRAPVERAIRSVSLPHRVGRMAARRQPGRARAATRAARPLRALAPGPTVLIKAAKGTPMDLSIVIVNWNTRDLLRDCLPRSSRGLPASGRGYRRRQRLRGRLGHHGAGVSRRSADRDADNLGFAGGNNVALRVARDGM
jgi:hypothetical protein